jgi:D-serine deaminase-like pyridoxal phosphate-dependent protein
MHEFRIPYCDNLKIKNIEKIKTPALVVFKNPVLKNLNTIKSYIEQVAPKSGYIHLCPHVKTNKSSYITKLMMDAGINSFKCTPNEVDMLIKSGAREIFIAYPLLERNAIKLAEMICANPDILFQVQIGTIAHAEILNKVKGVSWNYFIDIDVGMHRTGTTINKVFELYKKLSEWDNFKFIGLHGYDGHNHYKDIKLRKSIAVESMAIILKLYKQFDNNDIEIKKIIVAGSPSFRLDFDILYNALKDKVQIQVSPGTWIYWDSQYDNFLPGEFKFAAFVLAQVMDSGENQITLNLGHKRWAADQGEVQIFSESELKLKSFSEEHTVLKTIGNKKYNVGDYILIVPRHVCPTVNLYEHFTLIGEDSKIENLSLPIDARNR